MMWKMVTILFLLCRNVGVLGMFPANIPNFDIRVGRDGLAVQSGILELNHFKNGKKQTILNVFLEESKELLLKADASISKDNYSVFRDRMQCSAKHDPAIDGERGLFDLMGLMKIGKIEVERICAFMDLSYNSSRREHYNFQPLRRMSWKDCGDASMEFRSGRKQAPKSIYPTFLVKIKQGKIYLDWPWGGTQRFVMKRSIEMHRTALSFLQYVLDMLSDVPDTVFLYHALDYPVLPPMVPFPSLSHSPRFQSSDIPFPWPRTLQETIKRHKVSYNVDKPEYSYPLHSPLDNSNWQARLNKGAFFGTLWETEWSDARKVMLDLSIAHHDLLDAGFFDTFQRNGQNDLTAYGLRSNESRVEFSNVFDTSLRKGALVTAGLPPSSASSGKQSELGLLSSLTAKAMPFVDTEEYITSYKYLVVLSGNGAPDRLNSFIAHSGGVVLLQKSDWIQYSGLLQPWVHYVPIAFSGADVIEKIKWLRDHDDMARQIAINAYNFGKSYYRLEDYVCHMADIVYKLGEVVLPEAAELSADAILYDAMSAPVHTAPNYVATAVDPATSAVSSSSASKSSKSSKKDRHHKKTDHKSSSSSGGLKGSLLVRPRAAGEESVEERAIAGMTAPAPAVRHLQHLVNSSMLCAVFANGSLLMSPRHTHIADALRMNMLVMKKYCDFAVVSYTCPVGAFNFIQSISKSTGANFYHYRCVKPLSFHSKHVVKPMMYDRLLPLLPSYQRVWLLDEDISLQGFKPEVFLHAWDCAFWPRAPPLVVQPLVAENHQRYALANAETWAREADVLVAETNFVEVQIPAFDAKYFDWFVRYLVLPFLSASSQIRLSSDYGYDSLFCQAAKVYAEKNGIDVKDGEKAYQACAVIIAAGTAVHHLNERTLSKTKAFVKRSQFQASFFNQQFHKLAYWDFVDENNVFVSPQFAKWERAYVLSDQCHPVTGSRVVPEKTVELPQIKTMSVDSPKVYAFHFPQFHRDPLNDVIWGTGFSDWEGLMSSPTTNRLGSDLIFPSEMGYYDQTLFEVRKQQAKLAKEYGVDGFIYHHYWFNEPGLGSTLSAPLEALLRDGEPDVSFALHWANQNWTATWQGKGKTANEVIQAQHYPEPHSQVVTDHYAFLRRFFHHKNYIMVAGVPLFMVFCTYDVHSWPILRRLRELAMLDGFPAPGLHIPQVSSNVMHRISVGVDMKYRPELGQPDYVMFDADVAYPMHHNFRGNRVPDTCVRGVQGAESRPVYLSTLTTFDNTPRRNFDTATVWDRGWTERGVVPAYERDLVETLMYSKCCQLTEARNKGGNFVLVNAWNEWGEGMSLEPSSVFGRQLLEATTRAKAFVNDIGCSWEKFQEGRFPFEH